MAKTNAAKVTYTKNPSAARSKPTHRASDQRRTSARGNINGPYARPVIDEAERTPGSPRTVYEDFNQQQYDTVFGDTPEYDAANTETYENESDYDYTPRNQSPWPKLQSLLQGPTNSKRSFRIPRMAKTGTVLTACTYLYIAQASFWLIFTVGGISIVVDAATFGFTETTSGKTLILIGTFVPALICWMQLAVIAVMYRINPFSCNSQNQFITAASLCCAPVLGGFWPWSLLWIYGVLTLEKRK